VLGTMFPSKKYTVKLETDKSGVLTSKLPQRATGVEEDFSQEIVRCLRGYCVNPKGPKVLWRENGEAFMVTRRVWKGRPVRDGGLRERLPKPGEAINGEPRQYLQRRQQRHTSTFAFACTV